MYRHGSNSPIRQPSAPAAFIGLTCWFTWHANATRAWKVFHHTSLAFDLLNAATCHKFSRELISQSSSQGDIAKDKPRHRRYADSSSDPRDVAAHEGSAGSRLAYCSDLDDATPVVNPQDSGPIGS
jgi:hypothetical protein